MIKNQTHQFTIGLTDSTDLTSTATTIESAYNTVAVTIIANDLNPGGNAAPTVDAGTDQTITLPADATLDGTVNDDGEPNPPGAVTTLWTVTSGPATGTVTFADDALVDTTASFSLDGTYVLDLSADDGELTSNAEVTVTVNATGTGNVAPTVDAGTDQTITLANDASLDGTVSDDGLPVTPGTVTTLWTVTSGPATGAVTFADDALVDTTASFSLEGTYVLDLEATDGELTSNAQVTVTVNATTGSGDLLGHWLLNEGSGTAAGDSSGNGNNGILTNGPVWNGSELLFDGVDDYVNLGALDVPGSALTLTGWVQTDNLTNCAFQDCRILSKATGTAEQDHYWMISTLKVGSATRLRFRLKAGGTTSTLVASSGDLANDELFHIAATYDGSTMRLYKDGIEVGSLTKTGAVEVDNTVEAWIGTSPTVATSRPWRGLIADVRVYQTALTAGEVNTVKDSYNPGGGNAAPTVDAGTDQTITLPADATLDGTVNDDGEPNPPGAVTTLWTVTSGPATGTVTFADDALVDTTASFSLDGTYVLDLSADDGELTSNAEVTVTVNATGTGNVAPTVDAGTDQTITLANDASLDGTVSDDGLPVTPGTVTTLWTVTSGPAAGAVTFADDALVDTTASFSLEGTYVLDLEATDGELTSNAQVTVTVNATTGSGDLLGHWLLNEGSGTAAGDSSGNGNNGILTNGPVWNGSELLFDGVDDYVNLGALDVPGSALTLTGWVQTDNLTNCAFQDCRILSKATGTAEQDHYWMISTLKVGSATRLRFRLKAGGTTSTLVASSGDLANDELFHIAATYDGSTMRLYKDGIEVGSLAKTGAVEVDNTVEAWIGTSPTVATSRPWRGLIADVRVYQTALTAGEVNTVKDSYNPGGGNAAPTVDAGTDQTITLPADATLDGTVNDDGEPNPPGAVTTLWTVTSGPATGTVTFADDALVDTTASFSLDGTYVLDLSADDGELTSNAEVTVTVNATGTGNVAPTVDAGTDQTITLANDASLDGTVSDDGLPVTPGTVTTLWTVTSGPATGAVTFADDALVDTTASFSLEGTYVLDLEATDGELTSNAQVTVTVNATTGSGDLLGHWLLNEGSGTAAGDSSGNGNNGILTNGPVWNGSELLFDGVDDYVNLGALDVPGSALTLTGWVQTDNLTNCAFQDCRILSKATGTAEQDHYWMISTLKVGSATRLRFRLKAGGTTSTLVASSGDLANDELFHIAATYDGSTMRLYKDGIEVGSLAKTGAVEVDNTVEAWIGTSPTVATSRPWRGLIADVRVYQTALTAGEVNTVKDSYNPGGGNAAPTVDAGTDQTITLPADATLDGTVNDDGEPNPPGAVTTLWTVTSGPATGTVTFADDALVDTTASFSLDGTYVLDLSADDGELTSNAEVTVTVNATGTGNVAPTVDAGTDQTITLANDASLDGTVSDDGLPVTPGTVTTLWTVTSGPATGAVTFADDALVDTTASFSLEGTYVLDLEATDGELTSNAQVTVTVNATTGSGDLLGHWLLNEGSGTAAGDSSGNGNNGILTNGPVWNGSELLFDGVDDYVNLGALDVPGSALTLTGWVQTDNLTNCAFQDCRILSKATGTAEQDHYWMISTLKVGSATRLRFRLKAGGTTSTLVASSGDLANDELFHIAATYDGSTMRLYKDGIEVGSLTKTGAVEVDNTVEAWIGTSPTVATSRPWRGLIADVRVYQTALTAGEVNTVKDSYNPGGGNAAPTVDAGTDQTITLPADATLDGTVNDDGEPNPPGAVTTLWTVTSGPATGTVTFADDALVDTTASFSLDGTYVLDLSADDGELTSNAEVTVTVNATGTGNVAPTVDAGTDQTITLANDASLDGTVSDDGLPVTPGTVTTLWTVTSGPAAGAVTFADDALVDTTASFSLEGTYVLDLEATDGELTSNAQVTVTVNATTGSGDLLGHWPLNDGSGGIASDSSGNGHDGVLTNGPTWNGNELLFDGTDDYVNLGTLDVPGSALTLTGWVQTDNLTNCAFQDCRILSKATGIAEQDHYWMVGTIKVGAVTRLRFRLKAGGTTSTLVASSGDISNGDVFHVAAVYDGTTMRLYKDGIEVGSLAKTGSIDSNNTVEAWIGGNPTVANSRPWKGSLANVRIYQKSLTPAEVITIMNTDEVADITAPIISNRQVGTTSSSAIITWTTNEVADSNVSYGTSNAYEIGTVSDGSPVISHSITLSGLTENTTYHYQLESTDSSGNIATSIDFIFVTGAIGAAPELLMFDWNTVITQANRGFPRDLPPLASANGDWTSPINYADGTLYLRAEIKSGGQPVPQTMFFNYCVWQRDLVTGNNFGLEICTLLQLGGPLQGTAGEVITWNQKISNMAQISQDPIDWTRNRHTYGVAIKNTAGDPVSDFNGWNWFGEDPTEWYPLDMRFTVVVVPNGQTFSGWANYIN